MKIKPTIVIILMLLMIASNFTIGAAAEGTCEDDLTTNEDVEPGSISVTKEVWDSVAEEWVNEIDADFGETVRFRINVAYLEQHPDSTAGYRLSEIFVKDTLPNCLDYANDAKVHFGDAVILGESSVDGKVIWWNLSEDKYNTSYFTYGTNAGEPNPGIELALQPATNANWTDVPNNVTIEFNATVVAYGVNVNSVEVEATEHCSGFPMYGSAEATVNVEEEGCGRIEIEKKIKQGCEEWVDSIDAVKGDEVTFKITVTYHNDSESSHHATNIKVLDHITPGGVTYEYLSSTHTPEISSDGTTFWWNLSDDLYDGESLSIEFTINITGGTGTLINCAEVTADEVCTQCQLCNASNCVEVTVEEECIPHIEVQKTVWNGTDWAEFVDDLKLGDIVKFKIDIIWHACDDTDILNLIVKDDLPYCLDYLETVDIDSNAFAYQDPQIDPVGRVVYWNWTYNSVILEDGDYITIIFDTTMARYCDECECTYFNCVNVTAAACDLLEPGKRYYGDDCAEVDCRPPVPEFHKTAYKEGEGWILDEISTYQGRTIRFGLGLLYYGEDPLYNIQFVDVLPCILEYRDNVEIFVDTDAPEGDVTSEFTVEVSADGKTIWFNSTGGLVITDGQWIGVRFDAEVVDVTGGCPECPCEVVNYAYVRGTLGCEGPEFFMEDDIRIISGCPTCPPERPIVSGPEEGLEDEVLTFTFETIDSDGEQVYYMIDWGDEQTSGWLGPYDEGVEITKTHAYASEGTYQIKAKAKDEMGNEGEWTAEPHEVVITEEVPPPEEKELDVTVQAFSFGRIVFTVENTGDFNMTDINWTVNVTGGLLGRIEYEVNCSIDELNVGKSVKEATGLPIGSTSIPRGFGRVTVKISVTDGDYEEDFEFSGWLIGKIFIDTTVSI